MKLLFVSAVTISAFAFKSLKMPQRKLNGVTYNFATRVRTCDDATYPVCSAYKGIGASFDARLVRGSSKKHGLHLEGSSDDCSSEKSCDITWTGCEWGCGDAPPYTETITVCKDALTKC